MARNHELQAKVRVSIEADGAKEAEKETKQLTTSLDYLSEAFEENVQAQKVMREEIVRLERAGQGMSDEWEQLHDDLDKASTLMRKQRGEADLLAQEIIETGEATEDEVAALRRLISTMDEVVDTQQDANDESRIGRDAILNYKKAVQQTETAMERINEENQEYIIEAKARAAIDLEMAKNQERLARGGQLFGLSIDDLKKSLISGLAIGGAAGIVFKGLNLITDGFQRAKDAAFEFHRQAQVTFAGLEEEIARTVAQIPELTGTQDQLYDVITRTSREIARGPQETAEAFRKAQNLGLDYNEALEAVEASSIAAKVGGSELTETLVAATGTVNAYGQGLYDVQQVLDQYAYITQNSNLETSDLVTGMAKIISPAAEAGVTLEEVSAAMIVMNRQGDDFNEIADLLGNALTQIAVRGTQASDAFEAAAGMGFREFTAQGGTLIEGLALLEQHAEDTEQSISELVQGNSKFYRDMQAGRGILELTGRHSRELAEAYEGATQAQGALAEGAEAFRGTMYELNLELESARENAFAAEGSFTRGFQTNITKLKTLFFDEIARFSREGSTNQAIADAIIPELAIEQGYDFADRLERLAQRNQDVFLGASKNQELYKRNAEIIIGILEEQPDITYEELEARYNVLQAQEEQRIEEEKITAANERRVEAQERIVFSKIAEADIDQGLRAEAEAAADAAEKEAIAVERSQRLAEIRKITREQEAEAQDRINERILAFQQYQGQIYEQSQGIVQNWMDLNEQLDLATEPESIEEIQKNLEQLKEDIAQGYRKTILDTMVAEEGWTASITDLAVEMGLLTEEAGTLQKEFIRITTEGEKLAKMEGFKDLGIETQALAAERLADGIAKTAEEAFAFVDPKNWKEGVERGIVAAEEAFGIEPVVNVAQEEQDTLDELETQLNRIKDGPWDTDITADGEQAKTETKSVIELQEAIKTYIEIEYRGVITGDHPSTDGDGGSSTGGGGGDTAAIGADFTVPGGYYNDNFLLGLSSGEHVTVTPAAGSRNTSGITILVDQKFYGNASPSQVSGASKEGLYDALLKAGLVV